MSALFSVLFAVLVESGSSSVGIRVVPEAELFTVVAAGPLPSGALAGAFSGVMSLNGSPSDLPVTGTARAMPERMELSISVKYRSVPEDWARRFHLGDFTYRLRGRAGGAEIDWAGAKKWNEVSVENRKDAASGFVKLGAIRLTKFSLFESEGVAEVTVKNPLSFPLKVASTKYNLMANGRPVGSGSTAGMLLRGEQSTLMSLPIEIDHAELLSAVGSALRSGGEVEGKLQGTLVVRMSGGDIAVPLDLSGRLSLR
jgi:LEA14-like dessication related protein